MLLNLTKIMIFFIIRWDVAQALIARTCFKASIDNEKTYLTTSILFLLDLIKNIYFQKQANMIKTIKTTVALQWCVLEMVR